MYEIDVDDTKILVLVRNLLKEAALVVPTIYWAIAGNVGSGWLRVVGSFLGCYFWHYREV